VLGVLSSSAALLLREQPVIFEKASNWVDRGEPSEPKLAKTLRHFFGFDVPVEDAQLQEYTRTLVSMVAADASEVQVASYLGYLEDQHGRPRSSARHRRLEAIAIWHMAKAALVRDQALRLLRGEAYDATAEHERLSDWLRERILRSREPGRPPFRGAPYQTPPTVPWREESDSPGDVADPSGDQST
jgi:hypothetical protein